MLSKLTLFTAVMTLFLLVAGALVTGTGSGLAVPDWPLSFGTLMPPMIGGVFFEHGHRLIAGFVAILSVVQAAVIWRVEKRNWVKWLALSAVVAVLSQAVLGGMTVLFRLPTQVSVAHACLAQIFFCMVVVLALVTSSAWPNEIRPFTLEENTGISLPYLSLAVSLLFFFQLLMGASMRHLGGGLAIPDFPAVFGGIVPPFWTPRIFFHYLHRVGAFTLVISVSFLAYQITKRCGARHSLLAWVGALISLVTFQFILGAMVVWLRRPLPFTTGHLALGAICFACSVALTVQCFRLRRPVAFQNRNLVLETA
jgi:heme a synthase